jgi:hypothetical protein
MLSTVPGVTIIQGDVRRPREILEHEKVRDLLDLDRPLALTMTSLFHFVVDDEVAFRSTTTLIDTIASGSYVAMSHGLREERNREEMEKAQEDFEAAASTKVRSREEITRLFDGLELLEPGLVRAPLWRPEAPDDLLLDNLEAYTALVGVGRKP